MARDYYEVLGVDRRASDKDIKAAYRRLARQCHPDVTGDDRRATERFKEISEAYECLADPGRRRAYDLFGHPQSEGGLGGIKESISEVANLVSDLFRREDADKPEPGVDFEIPLTVSFREAFEGTKKEVEAELLRPCAACDGTGVPKEATWQSCHACDGVGKARVVGPVPLRKTCSTCRGRGKIPDQRCKRCSGRGTRLQKEALRVTVPPGVDSGARLRLKGRGPAGKNGGPPGDLYVHIEVAPDDRFFRDGDDLHTQVRVGLKEALAGGSVEVPLPHGVAVMTVPPGTQGGQVFRLREKGIPRLGAQGQGDLYVTVQLRIPKQLDSESQALLDALSARLPDL